MRETCGCVVLRESDSGENLEILMVRSLEGRWGIPKGGLEPGETSASCAVRETLEETGVNVRLIERVAEEDGLVAFLAVPFDPGIEPSPQPGEIAETGWYDVDHRPIASARQESIIRAALEGLRT